MKPATAAPEKPAIRLARRFVQNGWCSTGRGAGSCPAVCVPPFWPAGGGVAGAGVCAVTFAAPASAVRSISEMKKRFTLTARPVGHGRPSYEHPARTCSATPWFTLAIAVRRVRTWIATRGGDLLSVERNDVRAYRIPPACEIVTLCPATTTVPLRPVNRFMLAVTV